MDALAEATKHDTSKVRMELLPMDVLEDVSRVLTFGAEKYDAWNWAKGMDWSRLYGACLRHLTAWRLSDEPDPETGLSHLHHALCCLMFLSAYERRGIGNNDLPLEAPRT